MAVAGTIVLEQMTSPMIERRIIRVIESAGRGGAER
jgi:hypothetical protein